MSQIIAIYGKTCCLKSDVARAISRLTGYKLASRGEWITTLAMMDKLKGGIEIDLDVHRKLDEETRSMVSWSDPVLILESRFMDAVLHEMDDIFFVHLTADDDVRNHRWEHRREEGGGRTRQIGDGVAARDREDEQLSNLLYADAKPVAPTMAFDTSEGTAEDYALQIWSKFTGEDLSYLQVAGTTEMDKKQTKGLKPGPSAGEVAVYNALRNPFGGYITDDLSGRNVFIHKSVVEASGLKELSQGQRVTYVIVEDGFGGFRASNVEAE